MCVCVLCLLTVTLPTVNCTFDNTACGYSVSNTSTNFAFSYVFSISSLGHSATIHSLCCIVGADNYTVKNIRISTYILWRVFLYFNGRVSYTFVNGRNNESWAPRWPGLHYSVHELVSY